MLAAACGTQAPGTHECIISGSQDELLSVLRTMRVDEIDPRKLMKSSAYTIPEICKKCPTYSLTREHRSTESGNDCSGHSNEDELIFPPSLRLSARWSFSQTSVLVTFFHARRKYETNH